MIAAFFACIFAVVMEYSSGALLTCSLTHSLPAQSSQNTTLQVKDVTNFSSKSRFSVELVEVNILNCFQCGQSFDSYGNYVLADNSSTTLGNGTYPATINLVHSLLGNEEDNKLYVIPLPIIILWCFLYGSVSAAALFGNMLVMWVVVVSRRMRTVTNMLIANLALADFIIGLFAIPFQFQAALLQRWNLPDFMCAFCPFVQVLSVNISVFTLSAIAVDRYRAVLFPLKPRIRKRKAAWTILSIWMMGVVIALPTELDYKVTYVNDTLNGGMKPFCNNVGLNDTFRVYYHFSLLVIQYVLPLIILSVAYTHMAARLWGATIPGNREESRDAIVLRNKKKAIKMLALVVILFSVCWLPLQLYNALQFFIPSINSYKYINLIWFCFHWLAMSNSCVNPFIYAIYNDKFQQEFQSRLGNIFELCNHCNCAHNPNTDGNGYCPNDLNRNMHSSSRGRYMSNRTFLAASTSTRNRKSTKTGYELTTVFNEEHKRKSKTDMDQYLYQKCTKERILPKSQSCNISSAIEAVQIRCYSNPSVNWSNQSFSSTESVEMALVEEKRGNKCSKFLTHQRASVKNEKKNRSSMLSSAVQTVVVCSNSKLSNDYVQTKVTALVTNGLSQL